MNPKCIYQHPFFTGEKNLRLGKGQRIAKSRTASRAVERGLTLRPLTPRAVRCPPRHAAAHQDDELTRNCGTVPVEKIALPGQRITDGHKMLVLEVVSKGISPNPVNLQMNK